MSGSQDVTITDAVQLWPIVEVLNSCCTGPLSRASLVRLTRSTDVCLQDDILKDIFCDSLNKFNQQKLQPGNE